MAEKEDRQASGPGSKAADLTLTKVLAGGMAAATSAVLGSQFGTPGTVGGAAAGSVITMVGTSIYQRSLERTRDRVVQRMPRPAVGKTGRAATTTPYPRSGPASARKVSAASDPDRPARAAPSKRRWTLVLLVGPLLVFAIGMGAVTGIEWIKGSALSGSPGQTSIGEVLSPQVVKDPGRTDSGRSQDEPPGSPLPSKSPLPSQLPNPAERPGYRDLLPSPNRPPSESNEPDQPLLPGVEDPGS